MSRTGYGRWLDSFGEQEDAIVDVTSVVDRKVEALRAHKSQMLDHDPDEWIRDWMRENGKSTTRRSSTPSRSR